MSDCVVKHSVAAASQQTTTRTVAMSPQDWAVGSAPFTSQRPSRETSLPKGVVGVGVPSVTVMQPVVRREAAASDRRLREEGRCFMETPSASERGNERWTRTAPVGFIPIIRDKEPFATARRIEVPR